MGVGVDADDVMGERSGVAMHMQLSFGQSQFIIFGSIATQVVRCRK